MYLPFCWIIKLLYQIFTKTFPGIIYIIWLRHSVLVNIVCLELQNFSLIQCVVIFEPHNLYEIIILTILCDATTCLRKVTHVRIWFWAHCVLGCTNCMGQYYLSLWSWYFTRLPKLNIIIFSQPFINVFPDLCFKLDPNIASKGAS